MACKPSGTDSEKTWKKGAEEESEADETGVKRLSLDFECGQRVLSQVNILCQVRVCRAARALCFRETGVLCCAPSRPVATCIMGCMLACIRVFYHRPVSSVKKDYLSMYLTIYLSTDLSIL